MSSHQGPSGGNDRLQKAVAIATIVGATAAVLALPAAVIFFLLQSPVYQQRAAAFLKGVWAATDPRVLALLVAAILTLAALAMARRLLKRRVRPRGDELRLLQNYFQATIDEVVRELPLPSPDDTVGSLTEQVRAKAAYVASPYRAYQSSPLRNMPRHEMPTVPDNVVDLLVKSARAKQNALLVGDPGTGKTLVASLCFADLAENFRLSPAKALIPVLIRLNAMQGDHDANSDPVALLPEGLQAIGLDRLRDWYRSGRFFCILDGLDEVAALTTGASTLRMPPQLATLLENNYLVTCREAFYALYVDAEPVLQNVEVEAQLLPSTFEAQVQPFVHRYCKSLLRPDLAQVIIDAVKSNSCVAETVSRPLMLRMTVDVLAYELQQGGIEAATRVLLTGSDCLNAEIYERYVVTWVKREHGKGGTSRVGPFEKLRLIQMVAWEIFHSSVLEGQYGSFELTDLLIDKTSLARVIDEWNGEPAQRELHLPPGEVFREVAERTFLMISVRSDAYRFAHKSFFEYLLARHLYNHLIANEGHVAALLHLLKSPLPDEVIDFLRELLYYSMTPQEESLRRRKVEKALLQVVRTDARSVSTLMARQQAASLLMIVATEPTRQALRAMAMSDQHPFIRRAIAVGEALHHADATLLDAFIADMAHDAIARDAHMGYNRIYYGDQPPQQSTFADDGSAVCSRFFRACLRHLELERYRHVRTMALASIRLMLEHPLRRQELLVKQRDGLELLRAYCVSSDSHLGEVYERERFLLATLLAEVLTVHTSGVDSSDPQAGDLQQEEIYVDRPAGDQADGATRE